MIAAAIDIIAGFASHQLYFIPGEHHMEVSLLSCSYTALAIAYLALGISDSRRDLSWGCAEHYSSYLCSHLIAIHKYLQAISC